MRSPRLRDIRAASFPALHDYWNERDTRKREAEAAAHHGTWKDKIEAALMQHVTDGFGDFTLTFPSDAAVTAIQKPMIAEYQAKHGCNWFVAFRATRHAAFVAYDAISMALDAEPAMECA